MRPAHSHQVTLKLALVGCMAAALVAGGCETKGFFNPSEVGRFKHEPLLRPIVTTLDTGIEEPDDQFASAADVQPEDLVADERGHPDNRGNAIVVEQERHEHHERIPVAAHFVKRFRDAGEGDPDAAVTRLLIGFELPFAASGGSATRGSSKRMQKRMPVASASRRTAAA